MRIAVGRTDLLQLACKKLIDAELTNDIFITNKLIMGALILIVAAGDKIFNENGTVVIVL